MEIIMNVAPLRHFFLPYDASKVEMDSASSRPKVDFTTVSREGIHGGMALSSNLRFTPVDLAKRLKKSRNVRNSMLTADLFGEPGWDILLALYIADCEQYRLKVSDVLVESNVPSTTGLRWIETLVQNGMAARKRHAFDARITYIELTTCGKSQMTECLYAISVQHFA